MQAIRKIIETNSPSLTIELPEDYRNRKIEVIITPLENEIESKKSLSNFFGKLQWRGDGLAEQKKIRDEWD